MTPPADSSSLPTGDVLTWTAADAAEARRYFSAAGNLAFRCVTVGVAGTGGATLAVDLIEARVQYQ